MRRLNHFFTHKTAIDFQGIFSSFRKYQPPSLPKIVTNELAKLEVSLKTQQKLQDTILRITMPAELNKQKILTKEELKLVAIQLATEHVPTHVTEQMLVIGKNLYHKLIHGQSNHFIKSLFKQNTTGLGGCPAIFISPTVIKAAFATLDSYPPQIMSKVVSDGVSRVGNAISKLGTEQDVFIHPELIDPKPLIEFKNKYGIFSSQNNTYAHPSLQVLSVLRNSVQSNIDIDSPLLIQFKCFEILAGKELSSLDSKLIPKAVETKDVQNVISCLLHEVDNTFTKQQMPC